MFFTCQTCSLHKVIYTHVIEKDNVTNFYRQRRNNGSNKDSHFKSKIIILITLIALSHSTDSRGVNPAESRQVCHVWSSAHEACVFQCWSRQPQATLTPSHLNTLQL